MIIFYIRTQKRYKQVHDRKAKDQSFQVGHKVLMTDPAVPVGLVPKLYPPYKGPFTVMDCGPSNTYRLMDGNGKLLTSLIHFNRLFPFTERQVPPGTDDQEQPEEPPVDPPPPDNFPPDPGEDAGEDSQDDLDDSSTPRSTQDNDVGTDSHINSQTTATQQTHSDVVLPVRVRLQPVQTGILLASRKLSNNKERNTTKSSLRMKPTDLGS